MENQLKRLESVKFPSDLIVNLTSEEVDRSLICSICQEILKVPRECSNCHNNFCNKCISQWLQEKDNTCPFRCSGKIKLLNSHRIIIDSLRVLIFKCKNETNGCDFVMNYDNYIEHTQICEYNKLKCNNKDCKILILSKDMQTHTEDKCEYQSHQCKICAYEWIGSNKIPHLCGRVAMKQFKELKSMVDNFLIEISDRKKKLNDKISKLS